MVQEREITYHWSRISMLDWIILWWEAKTLSEGEISNLEQPERCSPYTLFQAKINHASDSFPFLCCPTVKEQPGKGEAQHLRKMLLFLQLAPAVLGVVASSRYQKRAAVEVKPNCFFILDSYCSWCFFILICGVHESSGLGYRKFKKKNNKNPQVCYNYTTAMWNYLSSSNQET